ncbi:MAG: hypothetical protein M3Q69_12035 [Acidobacteriota bacterium]|nr:hypothetical protein [Acidobacteriota bacterium]
MRRIAVFLCAILPIVAAAAQIPPEFQYDASKPLGVKTLRTTTRARVTIEEIEYASPLGGPVPAILVSPANNRRNASVLFAHWGLGNRYTFVEEAVDLASRGAVSLLIDSAAVRPLPYGKRDDAQYDEAIVQSVVDWRRGIDVLTARKDVDPRRIGFVGLSQGSHIGGILSGVERRISAFVLAGGTARFSDMLRNGGYRTRLNAEEAQRFDRWLDRLAHHDARHFVRNAAPARIFLQYAVDDEYVSLDEARAYYEAASEPKLMKRYDGGHELQERARSDRAEWLRITLHLDDDSAAEDERIAQPERWSAANDALPAAEIARLAEVLDIPGMQHVPVRRDIPYKRAGDRELKFDVYYPLGFTPGQKVPAVIIVNGQADPASMRVMRSFRSVTSAAQLVAARAERAAIVYDIRSAASGPEPSQRFTNFDDVRNDSADLIAYVRAHAGELELDADSLALWARSGGTTYGTAIARTAGLKAYLAFYPELDPAALTASGVPKEAADASTLSGLVAPGLPAAMVITSGDVPAASQQQLRDAAKQGSLTYQHLEKSQHAFDLLDDTEASRAALRNAMQFLHDHLPLKESVQ